MKKWLTKTIINIMKFPLIVVAVFLTMDILGIIFPNLKSIPINPHRLLSNVESGPTYIVINDLDEYTAFLQTQKNLPENFVTAEMLSCFGSYEKFYCLDETNIDVYTYVLKPKGYPSISIFVYHKPYKTSLKPIDKAGLCISNMTHVTTKESGKIMCDEGIEYHYLYGTLNAILWPIGDIQIVLSTSTGIVYHKFPQNHIFSKAFSKDPEDQLAVYNQLKAMIEGSNE